MTAQPWYDHLGAALTAALPDVDAGLLRTAVHALGEAVERGDSGLTLDALPGDTDWARALLASPLCSSAADRPLVLRDGFLAFLRHHLAEREIAAAVRARLLLPALDDDAMRTALPDRPDAGGPDWQQVALLAAVRHPFAVISGGPGTGKTTIVARALSALLALSPSLRIAATAPTGKAAARLQQSLQGRLDIAVHGTTLHRLLGYQHDEDRFRRNADSPLPFDVVVVDEASMVDLQLFRALFAALPATARLLLLGDPHQLPAVAAGQVLADLCARANPLSGVGRMLAAAWQPRGGAPLPVQSQAHALADHVVELRQNHRFRDRPGLLALAQSVPSGDLAALSRALRAGHDDLRVQPPPATAHDLVAPWLPTLAAMQEAADPAAALAALSRFRILCASRHGPLGTEACNRAVNAALDTGDGLRAAPILITQNDPDLQLYNGDLGILWHDGPQPRAWFQQPDGPRAYAPSRLPQHEPAHAFTIHKSQGSEFDEVLVALAEAGSPLNHLALLYTGLTRARTRATLIGSERAVAEACRPAPGRRSGLVPLL